MAPKKEKAKQTPMQQSIPEGMAVAVAPLQSTITPSLAPVHRSPRGDLCVWPSTPSSWFQFVVPWRRACCVCPSQRCDLASHRRAPGRCRRAPCGTICKEIAILSGANPKNFPASQGRTVTDRELASVTCRLHGSRAERRNRRVATRSQDRLGSKKSAIYLMRPRGRAICEGVLRVYTC